MTLRLDTPGQKFAAAVGVAAGAALFAASILRQAYIGWCQARPTVARLERAWALDPRNCELVYRLGVAYGLQMNAADEARGVEYARRAVRCQPANSQYWLALAETLEGQGRSEEAATAAERAAAVDPHNVHRLWEAANLLLRNGRTAEALGDFHHLLEGAPEYGDQVFSAAWRATGDGAAILARVVPDTTAFNLAYLRFLVSSSEAPWPDCDRVWDRLTAPRQRFPARETFPYLDALLNAGRGAEAVRDWNQLAELGMLRWAEARPADNLVVNGGFETPPMNGGLDWTLMPTAGVTFALDPLVHQEGTRSLAIRFEGLANLDFAGVFERVPVASATRYRLSAFMKSQAISSDSGPYVEAFDPRDPARFHGQTAPVVGTVEWSRYGFTFGTGPQTRELIIRVRRTPAPGRNNRIQGTLWVDDVRLTPESR